MRRWKKWMICLLTGCLMMGITGCGSKESTEKKNENTGNDKKNETEAKDETETKNEIKAEKLEYTNKQPLLLWENQEDMPYYNVDASGQAVKLTPYIAQENEKGGCVIICPGGGYQQLATEKEGTRPAEAFNENGISAFVLQYRVKPYNYEAVLSDILRAIRFVRYYSESFGIDPDKISVMGFSAGGHLAAMSMEHYDDKMEKVDAIDEVSAKPNSGILCYPVLTLEDPYAHKGSRENFLGDKKDDEKLRKKYSAELGVTSDTPPCFLWHCKVDTTVPYQGSQAFADAMDKAGVECEMHLYEYGAHGLGLATDNQSDVKDWFPSCISWLQKQGY